MPLSDCYTGYLSPTVLWSLHFYCYFRSMLIPLSLCSNLFFLQISQWAFFATMLYPLLYSIWANFSHPIVMCCTVSPFCTGKKCILRERPGQKEKLILRERAVTLGETLYYLSLTFTAMGIRKKIQQFYFYFCCPKGQIHQHYNSKNF